MSQSTQPKTMTRIALMAVALALTMLHPVKGRAQDGTATGLTLQKAVELALQHNRLVRNAELEVGKQQDKLTALHTRRLPLLDFTMIQGSMLRKPEFEFRKGSLGSYPGLGPMPSVDTKVGVPQHYSTFATVGATQPLSQQYKIGLGLKQQQLQGKIAEEESHAARQKVVSEVKRVYYGLLQTQAALQATRESIKLFHELDRVTDQYLLHQVVLKADSLEVKSRYAKERYNETKLLNGLATLKEQMNDLLGRDLSTDFTVDVAATAELDVPVLEVARAKALEQRPEVREAKLKSSQAELDHRLKKAEYIPDVSLAARYASPYDVEVLPTNLTYVGVLVTWEPFDWGRKKHELAEKSRTVAQADNGLKETEANVMVDVNSHHRKLRETIEALQVSELGVQASNEKVRVLNDRYRIQAALLKEVLEAEARSAEASYQYQQALSDYWTARGDFERAMGEEQ